MNLRPGILMAAGWLAQASAPQSRPSDVERIRVGATAKGALEPGDAALPGHGLSKAFTFLSESPGPVTISLESLDFDAFLRVEDETGEKLAEDDNGGVETNACVVLDAKAGTRYRILAAAAREGVGEITLTVAEGAVPRPTGAALLDAGIAYRAEAAERALSRGEKKAGAGHRLQEGSRRYSRSQFEDAKSAFESALALFRELGDRAGEARALGGLGLVYHNLGEIPKAREQHEECLALFRELGDRAGEARALGNLGAVYSSLGDYRKAREQHEKQLALSQDLGDRAGEVGGLIDLGNVLRRLGAFPEARDHYERGLAVARDLGNRRWEASAHGNLGLVYHSLGDYAKARAEHEESLALERELGDRAGEAGTLVNLGNVFQSLGDYAGARDHYERGLGVAREVRHRRWEATALGNLGAIYLDLGDYQKAREHGERHLELARELGDRAGEARALGNLGGVYDSLGDYAKARESAEASLALWERMGAGEEPLYPLLTLARAALAERDSARALALLGEARGILERPSLRGLETGESTGLRSRFSGWEEVGQDLSALRVEEAGSHPERRSRAAADGFLAAGYWKGRALLEGIAEHRAGGRSAAAIALRREWRETLARRDGILQRVSESIRKGEDPKTMEDLRNEVRGQDAKAQILAARLRDQSPRDAALDLPLGASPEAVRSALGKGVALVEFAEGKERLYAYALSEKGLSFHVLGERRAIHERVESFLSNFSDPALLGEVGWIADEGRQLFERLLAPALAAAGEGIERLVLVPTACLATLPFEALVAGSKGPGEPRSFADIEFLLDRYEVSYAPSSPLLVELQDLGPRRERGQVLLLADPRYPSEPVEVAEASAPQAIPSLGIARAVPEPGRFRRLGKTRTEALAIAGLLVEREKDEVAASLARAAQRRSASINGEFFDLHLGAAASRARLAGDLKPFSILHVAAHGYVDAQFPQRTGVALAFGEGEDGYFSIADALELDLDANLVVLSACETARGEARAGEGVESLARAFMYAGARAVVASLWQVEDRTAAETMEAFYGGVLKGGEASPARALREAKLAVRRSKESRGVSGVSPAGGASAIESGHPYFWAPFIYIGLPR